MPCQSPTQIAQTTQFVTLLFLGQSTARSQQDICYCWWGASRMPAKKRTRGLRLSCGNRRLFATTFGAVTLVSTSALKSCNAPEKLSIRTSLLARGLVQGAHIAACGNTPENEPLRPLAWPECLAAHAHSPTLAPSCPERRNQRHIICLYAHRSQGEQNHENADAWLPSDCYFLASRQPHTLARSY
jgi:hypothetical protein